MAHATVNVRFPGGKRVDARIGDFEIQTDQSEKAGGEASAPEPFDLFLASIASCAGIFALNFCQSRNIDAEGLGVRMECDKDEQKKLYSHMRVHLTLPTGFPEKYRGSIARAVELCTVKRTIVNAPEFEVVFDD